MSLLESAVGVTFGTRQLHVRNLVVGQPLLLVREPTNPADAYAVAIHDTSNNHLGYLPRGLARLLVQRHNFEEGTHPARVKSVGRSSVWGPYGFTFTYDLPDAVDGDEVEVHAASRKRPHARIDA